MVFKASLPTTAGLDLPELSQGWVYEGWIVNHDVTLSTGRFTSPDGMDYSNVYGGSEVTPPFPGEDFLQSLDPSLSFPLNLADGMTETFITVEPDLNGLDPTGDHPFLRFLGAKIPLEAAEHTNYSMSVDATELPQGFVTITITQR